MVAIEDTVIGVTANDFTINIISINGNTLIRADFFKRGKTFIKTFLDFLKILKILMYLVRIFLNLIKSMSIVQHSLNFSKNHSNMFIFFAKTFKNIS